LPAPGNALFAEDFLIPFVFNGLFGAAVFTRFRERVEKRRNINCHIRKNHKANPARLAFFTPVAVAESEKPQKCEIKSREIHRKKS